MTQSLMMASAMIAAGLVISSIPAQAMEPEEARDLLVGSWSNPQETWIFAADGSWTQYVGGAKYESSYELSSMPARMIRVKSTSSSKSYVFHLSPHDPASMSVYEDGKTEQLSFLTKLD